MVQTSGHFSKETAGMFTPKEFQNSPFWEHRQLIRSRTPLPSGALNHLNLVANHLSIPPYGEKNFKTDWKTAVETDTILAFLTHIGFHVFEDVSY